MKDFQIDPNVQSILQSQGIQSAEGVYGNHTVRLGNQPPVGFKKITADKIPFQGVKSSTKIERANVGMNNTVDKLFSALKTEGGIDAKNALKMLKTCLDYKSRLTTLKQPCSIESVIEEKLQAMSQIERAELTEILLSGKATVLELALSRECELSPKRTDLKGMLDILHDMRAVVTGRSGLIKADSDVLSILTAPGKFDAKNFERLFASADQYAEKLCTKKTITAANKGDFLFRMAPAVERLSNTKLAALWEMLNSAEVTNYQQTQLNNRGKYSSQMVDMLFTVQGLVISELANRVGNDSIDKAIAKDPENSAEYELTRPVSLTKAYAPAQGPVQTETMPHDITASTLTILSETSSRASTKREETEALRDENFAARKLSMTSKEAGDLMRKAKITINFSNRRLTSPEGILKNPHKPMDNIFHLAERGKMPKGKEYVDLRNEIEKTYFPEYDSEKIDADERPTYGALNLPQSKTGAAPSYGCCCIVLKPQVAQRSTFIYNDTFYAVKMHITQDRVDALRTLCETELPKEARDQLADPNSEETLLLNQLLDRLMSDERTGIPLTIAKFGNLNVFPKNDAHNTILNKLMVRCFCEKDDAREIIATWDNIETLLDNCGEVSTSMIAQGVERQRQGGDGKCVLATNYIEAQIHGSIIPSRDIEELVINRRELKSSHVPDEEIQKVIDDAEKFSKEFGVKLTIIDEGEDDITEMRAEALPFSAEHKDPAHRDAIMQSTLDHLADRVIYSMRNLLSSQTLATLFPKGADSITPKQLETFREVYVREFRVQWESLENTITEQADQAALTIAAKTLLGLPDSDDLTKFEVFNELPNLQFANDAQKTAFCHWVMQSKNIRSAEELRLVHERTVELSNNIQALMDREPPASSADLFRVMVQTQKDATGPFQNVLSSDGRAYEPDELMGEFTRIGSLAASFLSAGDPPMMSQEKLNRFVSLMQDPVLQRDLAILNASLGELDSDAAQMQIKSAGLSTMLMLQAFSKRLGAPVEFETQSLLDIRFLSEENRAVIAGLFPETQAAFEKAGKIIPAPAPNNAEALPKTHDERRGFLLTMLDQHLKKEQGGMEIGRYDHGRGHIARAYIYANVFAGIMEKAGVPVDRNLLLCGIAGHDSGRTQGGTDYYEVQSTENTVKTMQTAFGEDALGKDYEEAFLDSIAHHGQNESRPKNVITVESMLLNSADSLDYGRISGKDGMDIGHNAFLRRFDGIPRMGKVDDLLARLAEEADFLQKLTNPLCRLRPQLQDLEKKMLASTPDEIITISEQKNKLQAQAQQEFEAQQKLSSEAFMSGIERTIRENKALFPLLNAFYFTAENGNLEPVADKNDSIDAAALEGETRKYAENLQSQLAARFSMPGLFAPGTPILNGPAKEKFLNLFHDQLGKLKAKPEGMRSASELVATAFEHAYQKFMPTRKAAFEVVASYPFENEAQKAAALKWVCSAGSIKSAAEVKLCLERGMAFSKQLTALAQKKHPSGSDLMREVFGMFESSHKAVNDMLKATRSEVGPDDINGLYSRLFSLAWSFASANLPEASRAKLTGLMDENLVKDSMALAMTDYSSLNKNMPQDSKKLFNSGHALKIFIDAVRHREKLAPIDVDTDGLKISDLSKPMRQFAREIAPESCKVLHVK